VCGLVGYWRSDGGRRFDLDAALGALVHRGPDDMGTFDGVAAGRRCSLGHVRLSILDLSPLGHQPMHCERGRYVIVFNGEVFNFADIRRELEAEGAVFRSNSDTEVILEGYARRGPAILQRMRGMFALAIFDRETGALFLARDRMGIKPLYVAIDPAGIAFASEVRALLASGCVERRLSRPGLASYLRWGSVADPQTLVRGVQSLPAGSYLVADERGPRVTNYWRPDTRTRARGRDEALEVIKPVLREAVELRLVSDVPVGVFLSGGVDSSVVTAIAARASREPLHTFNVGFHETGYDESPFAAEIARAYGCVHHAIALRADAARDRMAEALGAQDQPSSDGINTFFVSEAVRRSGIKVALSGLGGDELFAGYEKFRYFGLVRRLAGRGPRGVRLSSSSLPSALQNRLARIEGLLGGRCGAEGGYAALRSMFNENQVTALLGRSEPEPSDEGLFEDRRFPTQADEDVTIMTTLELQHYMKDTLLRDADVMSMAHALEVRVPLIDHVLVETVLPIAGALKIRDREGRNKGLLVDASPPLPKPTSHRPKMGFALPFDVWFRGPLRGWVEGSLFDPGSPLDPTGVRALWEQYLAGGANAWRVFCLVSVIEWCRTHRLTSD
jgi:asparagine synthase (glutamine-hydrolysing)